MFRRIAQLAALLAFGICLLAGCAEGSPAILDAGDFDADDATAGDSDDTAGDAGTCEGGCPDDLSCCSGQCINLRANPNHCGLCGETCQDGPDGEPGICDVGECTLECAAGTHDCDGDPTNGCETDAPTQNNCDPCNGQCGPVCGDGTCDSGEDCSSCSPDCGSCGPVCGNGSCESGEDCSSCSSDCGSCGPVCGNGSCESGETCGTCSDCQYGHQTTAVGADGSPCSAPENHWRCINSTNFGTTLSQVCRNGAWVNFNLSPSNCAACVCDYSSACAQ